MPRHASPPKIEPQLPGSAGDLPEGSDWLHEVDRGGTRVMAYLHDRSSKLMSATGQDRTRRFRHIAAALQALAERHAMVIDGEVAPDDGGDAPKLFAFDLLWLDGEDLRDQPLLARKRRLKRLVGNSAGPIAYVDHVSGEEGRALYGKVVRGGGKGVLSKRKHAHYVGGLSETWLEIKPETVRERHLEAFRKSVGR
jgi:bifunctional non-homologous end joining protein LigD